MSYNAKNYTEQGGNVTHFGGKVIFEEGCEVEGNSFTPAANQAASTATTIAQLKDDINALLTKLKTAGLMEADAESNGGSSGTLPGEPV
jgi:hypothetical protein